MKTRDIIAFFVSASLQDLQNEDANKMAAAIVFYVMTHSMEEDIPEEERWKWVSACVLKLISVCVLKLIS